MPLPLPSRNIFSGWLRGWRLQFSLRALLVMLTCVGSGLAIYRWPWETIEHKFPGAVQLTHARVQFSGGAWRGESADAKAHFAAGSPLNYRVSTTWHRGWNGRALRHGISECWRLADDKPEELFLRWQYVDDELTSFTWFEEGEVWHSEHYRDGLLHGPFLERGHLHSRREGNFERGKRAGVWRDVRDYGETDGQQTEVELTYSFRDGLCDGDWTWKSSRGSVLQTAKYEAGQLISWNDKPIQTALQDLLAASNLSAEDRKRVLASTGLVKFQLLPQNGIWNVRDYRCLIDGQQTGLVIQQKVLKIKGKVWYLGFEEIDFTDDPQKSALQIIVEHALARSDTLVVRDGHLVVERIYQVEKEK